MKETERKQIEQVFREVERKMGRKPLNMQFVTGPEHDGDTGPCACGHCHEQCSDTERPNMGITKHLRFPNQYRLVYSPGVTKHFSTWMLAGTIAHEIGHVALGHVGVESTPAMELAADLFAVEHGFGEALQRVMERNAEQDPERSWYASDSHPAVQERIWRLRNLNNQTEKRAA